MPTRPLLRLHKAFPNVFSVSHVVPVDRRPIEKRSGRVMIWKRNVSESDLHLAQLRTSDEPLFLSLRNLSPCERAISCAHGFVLCRGPSARIMLLGFCRKSMLLRSVSKFFVKKSSQIHVNVMLMFPPCKGQIT